MRRTCLAAVALLAATACGVLPGSSPEATPSPVPTVAPAAAPTATKTAVSATATAAPLTKPTNTPEPAPSNTVYVGNTDGEGVFLRKTPVMADRLNAYADGTQLTIIGDDVDGDGQHWHHVRAPDGTEGYVPAEYTTDTRQ